jgi:uncharacterized membrane protein YgdD (TMEM256/DUF423 family)
MSLAAADRPLVVAGALLGLSAVGLGAFGAHALEPRLTPEALGWWKTAVSYHLPHSAATVTMGALAARGFPGARPAGWLFAAGVTVFAGTLYLMAVTGIRVLGAVTPVGGLLMLAGWAALALGALKRP